jgi:hypothetical protein
MYRVTKPGGTLFISVPNARDIPFRLSKTIAEWRGTWTFGYEDDLTTGRLRRLAERAGLKSVNVFAFNPIVGWWFLPYGSGISSALGLNTLEWHTKRFRFGHVVCLVASKPVLP